MPKISIILPSFNVAAYIRECIESVLVQSLADIEILCIDAGSTDGTCEILQEYAAKDSRIRFIHSERKSYGYQINLGMELAMGAYLGIVETDDCIAPNMYEVLYEAALEYHLDYVKAGIYTMVTPYEGERYLLEHSLGDEGKVISFEYFLEKGLSPDVYIWNGIYSCSFLKKAHVRLNESPGAAFQDCGLRYLTDMNLGRGMFLKKYFYCYRRDNAAASTYSSDFVRYNLEEYRYLRGRMEEYGLTDRGRMAFMAREAVRMALAPYRTFRACSLPNGAVLSALGEFREMILRDREQGLLQQGEMMLEQWVEMCLFTEQPEAFEAYIGIRAKADYGLYWDFVREMRKKHQVVLFCTGKTAEFALCLLRRNQLKNVMAVCDNAPEKQGKEFHGHKILSPAEAVRRYPQAHYLVANRTCSERIRGQLVDDGIGWENISVYELPLDAFKHTELSVCGP